MGEPWGKESSLGSRDTLLSAAGKDYKGVGMASLAAEGGGIERGQLAGVPLLLSAAPSGSGLQVVSGLHAHVSHD